MALGLARDDLLAGAPAFDAYVVEGEHASSPVEKALEGSGPGPCGCPEPFFLVDSAKLFSVSTAASVDDWRLVWEQLDSRSSLRVVLELLDTVSDAPCSPFREREYSVYDSEHSGNLAHELFPFPSTAVTLFLLTHLFSPESSRRRTAT